MVAPYIADLIVFAPDRPDVALVAEVKSREVLNRGEAEEQLKRYMLDRSCAVALLVTPNMTWVYCDSYRDYSAGSIDCVAELATDKLLGPTTLSGTDLERKLFDWLERLAASWPAALPSDEAARRVVIEHVVPAVVEGRVVLQARAA